MWPERRSGRLVGLGRNRGRVDGRGSIADSTASSTATADGPMSPDLPNDIYEGFWTQGGSDDGTVHVSFDVCGVAHVEAEGALPDLESCTVDVPMFMRVRGELLLEEDRIIIEEVLEGPCWKHSCEAGGDPCDCSTFEDVCNTATLSWGMTDCDLVHQGCLEGAKCMPWANDGGNQWNSTRCADVDANAALLGEPCSFEGPDYYSGLDDCDYGLMCWDVDPMTHVGACAEVCTANQCNPDPFCDTPGTTCAIVNGGSFALCLPGCDPLAPSCAASMDCYETETGFYCLPDAP